MKKVDPKEPSLGSFTDFNVWDDELPDDQMRVFTKCEQIMKGNLIPWNAQDWMMTPDISQKEYTVDTIDFSEICQTKNELAVFPEHLTIKEGWSLCQSFGGTIVKTQTNVDYEQVKQTALIFDAFILKIGD